MAVRQVLRMGHPLLLRVAQPVADPRDPAVATLLEDLFDTMAACNGAGLAAPQIGVSVRVVVFGVPTTPTTSHGRSPSQAIKRRSAKRQSTRVRRTRD